MKTISIFAYKATVVEDFLKLINPMVKKLFNFEIYLYTAYSTADTIEDIDTNLEDTIRMIKMLKSRYKHVNKISVYGLIAAAENSSPQPENHDEFKDWLLSHISDLDLDGIALDYEFSENWQENKNHYTNFSKMMAESLNGSKQLSVDVGSYRYSGVNLQNLSNTSTKIVNMGMYSPDVKVFRKELWAMLSSVIKHEHQVPAIDFTPVNGNLTKRLDYLQGFGYKHIAIFNPLANPDEYALDISKFIDSKSNNIYWWPSLIGAGGGLSVCMLLGIASYCFNLAALMQIYIVGGLAFVSLGSICWLCFNIKSMLHYMLLIFASTIFVCCTVWLTFIYYFAFCKGNLLENIECVPVDKAVGLNNTIKAFKDIELGNSSSEVNAQKSTNYLESVYQTNSKIIEPIKQKMGLLK